MKSLQVGLVLLITMNYCLYAELITVGPEHEARYHHILTELRCLVCQNQTLADSPSDFATDIRLEVKEMLEQGATDKDILKFMSDRYGDFVLYKPPVRTRTLLLWFGPFLLLVGGIVIVLMMVRKRAIAESFDGLDEQQKQRLDSLLKKDRRDDESK